MSEAEIKKPVKVFEALYNPMVEESSSHTISIHFSREGAEKAIKKSQAKAKRENTKMRNWCLKQGDIHSAERIYGKDKWDKFQWWGINETEILP